MIFSPCPELLPQKARWALKSVCTRSGHHLKVPGSAIAAFRPSWNYSVLNTWVTQIWKGSLQTNEKKNLCLVWFISKEACPSGPKGLCPLKTLKKPALGRTRQTHQCSAARIPGAVANFCLSQIGCKGSLFDYSWLFSPPVKLERRASLRGVVKNHI